DAGRRPRRAAPLAQRRRLLRPRGARRLMRLLCRTRDVPPGTVGSYLVGRVRVVVIHSPAGFSVLRDACPHQGAPLSAGRLVGTMLPGAYGEYKLTRAGEVVRCPWHAWEFDVRTGCSLVDPEHD